MRDRSGALPTRPTPRADDPRTAPLPPAAQAALARALRALRPAVTQ